MSPERSVTYVSERSRVCQGSTTNGPLLRSLPPGIVTWSLPVVAPAGTTAEISVGEPTLNDAALPLKVTLVAPVRFVPNILMVIPGLPNWGRVLTNGPRPIDRL